MDINTGKFTLMLATVCVLLFISLPAHAFRCGSKIVRVDMHEQEVIKVCGEPTSIRYIGRALKNYDVPITRHRAPGITERYYPGWGTYVQEVVITEYVYNFGPRKLMRRLLFEGGILVSIETIGYGYREK